MSGVGPAGVYPGRRTVPGGACPGVGVGGTLGGALGPPSNAPRIRWGAGLGIAGDVTERAAIGPRIPPAPPLKQHTRHRVHVLGRKSASAGGLS
jgi:hypothetical protein